MKNQMRLWAMGRKTWPFAGSELAGQRPAAVMNLVNSAKLKGHHPWQHLRNVSSQLPAHLNPCIQELLPHCWQPNASGAPT